VGGIPSFRADAGRPGERAGRAKPKVLDIIRMQGHNRVLVKVTNVRRDWSLSLKLADPGGTVTPDVRHSAP
jgi:hypothetical protein